MPWNTTLFTQALHLLYPITQAPMAGGPSSPALASTVSNYGCLGSLAAGYMEADELDIAIQEAKKATSKPLLINFFIPAQGSATAAQMKKMHAILEPFADILGIELPIPSPPFAPSFESQIEVFLDHNMPIFSFTFGLLPSYWQKILKERKVTLIGTATSAQEALLLERRGIDFIVCQGKEAGGHRGSFAHDARLPTFELLKQCLPIIQKPLIASGGIMTSQDILNALQLGAVAVQMGSVFLTTEESGAHSLYKKALLSMQQNSTTLTRAFTGKYARGLSNEFITKMRPYDTDILEYPIQDCFTKPLRHAAYKQARLDLLSLWAGERAFLCQNLRATQLLDTLTQNLT